MGALKVNCHSKQKPFSHRGLVVTRKERDVVREKKKKKEECERQVEIFERRSESESLEGSLRLFLSLSWPVRIIRFLSQFEHRVLLRNEGVPSFRLCASLFCEKFRRKEVFSPLLHRCALVFSSHIFLHFLHFHIFCIFTFFIYTF